MGLNLIQIDIMCEWVYGPLKDIIKIYDVNSCGRWPITSVYFPNSQLIRRNPNPIFVSTLLIAFDLLYIKFHRISSELLFVNELDSLRDCFASRFGEITKWVLEFD